MIFPCSLASLAAYPTYQDTRFSRIRLTDVEIPLAPIPTLSPIQRSWGFPLVCAIFPGSDWSEAPGLPLGYRLRFALSELLRSACLPEAKANYAGFLLRLQEIGNSGVALLASKLPPLLWPPIAELPTVAQPTQGWFIFHVFSFFLASWSFFHFQSKLEVRLSFIYNAFANSCSFCYNLIILIWVCSLKVAIHNLF